MLKVLHMLPGTESQLEAAAAAELSAGQFRTVADDRPTMLQSVVSGGVAVVRVHGAIQRRESWWSASYPVLIRDLQLLAESDVVSAAVIDFDSPGGEAMGCAEACQALAEFPKPLIGFASGYCTSAALRLACYCDRILAGQSAELGNIGTRISLDDFSEANRMNGIRRVDVVTGYAKAIGSHGAAVTDEQKKFLQTWVQRLQIGFRSALQVRGLTVDQINAVSSGEWWDVEQAQRLGLIDGVSTLEDVVAALVRSPASFTSMAKQEFIMNKETQPPAGQNVAPLSALQSQLETPAAEQSAAVQTPAAAVAPVQQQTETPAAVVPSEPSPAGTQGAQQALTAAPAAGETPPPASPVQTAAAAPQPEQQTEQPATFQQIIAACEGHQPSADFVVEQQRLNATPSQVRKNFVDQLVAAAATQSAPAGGGGKFKVDAASDSSHGKKTDASDPMQTLEGAIEDVMKSDGVPRMQAARQVLAENPQWLQAYQEANRAMTPQQKAERRRRNCGSVLATTMEAAS